MNLILHIRVLQRVIFLKYLNDINYIYSEVNTEKVYKDCALIEEIDVFLKERNFIRVACKMCGNYGWGDAFYVKIKND